MSVPTGETAGDHVALSSVSCDLDLTPGHEVRRLVRGLLADRDDRTVCDAVLVADELVSNAHRHGDAPRVCRIGVTQLGRCLRIEVDDASHGQPRLRTPDQFGGCGLVLVDQLAESWGVRTDTRHKTAWAELSLAGDSPR